MGYNVLLTGPPGSGKTFLLKKYIDYLKEKNRGVAVTASTGIAATHLDGRTIHSWSGLGIKEELNGPDLRKLLQKSYLRKRFKKTGVLVIDEISMLHAFQFDLLNQICQAFKNSFKLFGGMQIVCSGDFFQLPPVGKEKEAKFVTESKIWKAMNIKICYLKEQYRQKDNALLTLLNHIRSNKVERARRFLESIENSQKSFSFVPTKLYTHNIDVDAVNRSELSKIQGKEFAYHMKTKGPKPVVDSLKSSCLVPEELVLKKGAKVMFVKNNFDEGYVNGTLGKVKGFSNQGLPLVRTFHDKEIQAHPVTWRVREQGEIKAQVTQTPLRLAWAITVHKSQGMNLDAAEIDLSKSFVKGMGYVALSRLSSLEGLKLEGFNRTALCVQEKAFKMDEEFKRLSGEVGEKNKKLSKEERERRKERFLNSLPKVKTKKGEKKEKARLSTYQKTKNLVEEKLSIKEISQKRRLKWETILRHLEKLIEKEEGLNLEHLRLSPQRFQKIKLAFQQTDDWRLSPVKEILGEEFSWQEIKIARLFLKKEEK